MKIFFALLFLTYVQLIPQNFLKGNLSDGNLSHQITIFKKSGLSYISSKELAEKFDVKSFYNTINQKIELKFSQYSLKFTAKNPFIVLASKTKNESKVFQLPVSSVVFNNQIYIPFEYSKEILTKCFERELKLEILNDENNETGKKENLVNEEKGTDELIQFDWNIDEKVNGVLLTLKANSKISSVKHSISKDIIIIKLPDLKLEAEKLNQSFSTGLIKEITAKNLNSASEIQIALRKNYSSYEVLHSSNEKEILITIHNKKFERKISSTKKDKWNFDVIVIDAGHGGKDFGAIGYKNTVEKEINLAVALKLGKLITENFSEVKVVQTRSKDNFVELFKRGKIANENNGKLFISIHCNSVPKKVESPNGFEFYLLRPGRTAEAIEIAERENSVIEYEDEPSRYQKLTDENFILVSMAHSSYMKYSEKFSELLDKNFKQNVSLASRGIKQAGFYVLVGASMPSVLIECGYVTNKKDSDYLKSKQGQSEIAQAIFDSIKNFKSYYDSIIETE